MRFGNSLERRKTLECTPILLPTPPLISPHSGFKLSSLPIHSVERRSTIRREAKESYATYTVQLTDNDQTFETSFCAQLDSGTLIISIVNDHGILLKLPSCVAITSANTFTASHMIVENWSLFPSPMRTLVCTSCQFKPSSTPLPSPVPSSSPPSPTSAVLDGFNSDGTTDWDELFGILPGLGILRLSSSHINSTLPTRILSTLVQLELPDCGLHGTIPSTIFALNGPLNAQIFTLNIQGNSLVGAIPSNIFAPIGNNTGGILFSMLFASNRLEGSIPNLATLALSSPYFQLDFGSNRLNGTIPNSLSSFSLGSNTYSLKLNNNALEGPIPSNLFAAVSSGTKFTFDASDNALVGPLPPTIFRNGWYPSSLTFNLANNDIGGSIPPGFISSGFTSNRTVTNFYLNMGHNHLQQSIPETLLFNYYTSKRRVNEEEKFWTRSENSVLDTATSELSMLTAPVGLLATSSFTLDLSLNSLSGSIPETLMAASFASSGSSTAHILLNANFLSNQMPEQLLSGIPSTVTSLLFSAKGNYIRGSPPLCPSSSTLVTLDISDNSLDGTIPLAWSDCKFSSVSLSNNYYLAGSIPPLLFTSSDIVAFDANMTSLNGTLPPFGTTLTSFHLEGTFIDFCDSASTSAISSYTGACGVSGSSACGCTSSYGTCSPSGSVIDCLAPRAAPVPIAPPITPVTPTAPSFPNPPYIAPTLAPSMTNPPSLPPQVVNTPPQASPNCNTPQFVPNPKILRNITIYQGDYVDGVQLADDPVVGRREGGGIHEYIWSDTSYITSVEVWVSYGFVNSLILIDNLGNSKGRLGTVTNWPDTESDISYYNAPNGFALSGANITAKLNSDPYYNITMVYRFEPEWSPLYVDINANNPCSSPSSSESPSTSSPHSTCLINTQPGPQFTCNNGVWMTNVTINQPTLTIPPGAGNVVIIGAIASQLIVIRDLNTTITLEGCASNLTAISVELTPSQVDRIGKRRIFQNLITATNTSCTNLNLVSVETKVFGGGCKKLNVDTSISTDRRVLSATFSLNTSACNRWWIILAAVLGVLVVLAVAVIVLLVIFNPWAKLQARPYSGSDGTLF